MRSSSFNGPNFVFFGFAGGGAAAVADGGLVDWKRINVTILDLRVYLTIYFFNFVFTC